MKMMKNNRLNKQFGILKLALNLGLVLNGAFLLGCQPQADNTEAVATTHDTKSNDTKSVATKTVDTDVNQPSLSSSSSSSSASASDKLVIDWSKIDSQVKPIAAGSFEYPFAVDSKPVKAYVDFFHVTPAEAQHSLTVGTASNEPLPALFDELGEHYVSHELTDGKEVRLIVHTTADVAASEHVYVFAEPFAKGLTMPILIEPQS